MTRKCMKDRRPYCGCDECIIATARIHIDGDINCGRDWQCWCGACRIAHRIESTTAGKKRWPGGLEIDERFARIARLESRLAAVKAIRREEP